MKEKKKNSIKEKHFIHTHSRLKSTYTTRHAVVIREKQNDCYSHWKLLSILKHSIELSFCFVVCICPRLDFVFPLCFRVYIFLNWLNTGWICVLCVCCVSALSLTRCTLSLIRNLVQNSQLTIILITAGETSQQNLLKDNKINKQTRKKDDH